MNIEISSKEYAKMLNWEDAIFYCQLLEIDGKTDWRMPTREEVKEIYESEKNDLTDLYNYYWSSTKYNTHHDYAWVQIMSTGKQVGEYIHYLNLVRAVRDI